MHTKITPIRKHPILKGILWLVILELVFSTAVGFSYNLYNQLEGTVGYFVSTFSFEIPAALLAFAIVVWMGGRRLLSVHVLKHSTWLRGSGYFFLLAFVPTVIGLISDIHAGTPLASDWVLSLALALAFDLVVGMYEEGQFRGLIFGMLLPRFGRTRKGLFFASIVASLVFGIEHVNILAGTEPVIIIQHVLKVLQVGILGMFFCALTFREKSLWPAIILHGLWDFSADLGTLPFEPPANPSYTQSGAGAWDLVLSYLYYILLELPLLIQAILILKDAKVPDGGWFAKTELVADEQDENHTDTPALGVVAAVTNEEADSSQQPTSNLESTATEQSDEEEKPVSPFELPHAGPSQKNFTPPE